MRLNIHMGRNDFHGQFIHFCRGILLPFQADFSGRLLKMEVNAIMILGFSGKSQKPELPRSSRPAGKDGAARKEMLYMDLKKDGQRADDDLFVDELDDELTSLPDDEDRISLTEPLVKEDDEQTVTVSLEEDVPPLPEDRKPVPDLPEDSDDEKTESLESIYQKRLEAAEATNPKPAPSKRMSDVKFTIFDSDHPAPKAQNKKLASPIPSQVKEKKSDKKVFRLPSLKKKENAEKTAKADTPKADSSKAGKKADHAGQPDPAKKVPAFKMPASEAKDAKNPKKTDSNAQKKPGKPAEKKSFQEQLDKLSKDPKASKIAWYSLGGMILLALILIGVLIHSTVTNSSLRTENSNLNASIEDLSASLESRKEQNESLVSELDDYEHGSKRLLADINSMLAQDDYAGAMELCDSLSELYPGTDADKEAARLKGRAQEALDEQRREQERMEQEAQNASGNDFSDESTYSASDSSSDSSESSSSRDSRSSQDSSDSSSESSKRTSA